MSKQEEHPADLVDKFDYHWRSLITLRTEQLALLSADLDKQKKLEEKWQNELQCLIESLNKCNYELGRLVKNRPKSSDVACQFPDAKCSNSKEPAKKRETFAAENSVNKTGSRHEEAHQGGPAREADPSRRDAAIQVTPPPPTFTETMQNMRIDLSRVQSSDTSVSPETNRARLERRDVRDCDYFFADDPRRADIHKDPQRRLRNLSEKKVADQLAESRSSFGSSSNSESEQQIRRKERRPHQRRPHRTRSNGKPTSNPITVQDNGAAGPFSDSETDSWAVSKITKKRSPTGEKIVNMAIMRVDKDKPCDVSKYPVGGVLTFDSSVFDTGQKKQR